MLGSIEERGQQLLCAEDCVLQDQTPSSPVLTLGTYHSYAQRIQHPPLVIFESRIKYQKLLGVFQKRAYLYLAGLNKSFY
jgi:hypothetical protein